MKAKTDANKKHSDIVELYLINRKFIYVLKLINYNKYHQFHKKKKGKKHIYSTKNKIISEIILIFSIKYKINLL